MAFEHYIRSDGKNLRLGYTTGTCAALAAAGAAEGILTGQIPEFLSLITPNGIEVCVKPVNGEVNRRYARCGVIKDAGDDNDVTNGLMIMAQADLWDDSEGGGIIHTACEDISRNNSYCSETGTGVSRERIRILGGRGIGRVTKPGLDQKAGEAAINRVPREMIRREVLRVCEEQGYEGGITITISAPDGEEAAKKTLNEQLGIVGGISIIGTSGIVEPMSMKAYADSVRLQIRQAAAMDQGLCAEKGQVLPVDMDQGLRADKGQVLPADQGQGLPGAMSQGLSDDTNRGFAGESPSGKNLILTPGNYGLTFLREHGYDNLPDAAVVVCSNFIGEALDEAVACGFDRILLVGHVGKLVKLAAGIMNTHSSMADGRNEIFAAHAALAGASSHTARKLMEAATTDACIFILKEEGIAEVVLGSILKKAQIHVNRRCAGISCGIIMFSNVFGELIRTPEEVGKGRI